MVKMVTLQKLKDQNIQCFFGGRKRLTGGVVHRFDVWFS